MKKIILVAFLAFAGFTVFSACKGPTFSPDEETSIIEDWENKLNNGLISDAQFQALLNGMKAAQNPDGFDLGALLDLLWSGALTLLYAKTGLDLRRRGPPKPMDAEKIAALNKIVEAAKDA